MCRIFDECFFLGFRKMIDLGTEIDHVIEFYETLSYMNISLNRDCLNDQENRQKFLWKRKKINYIKVNRIPKFLELLIFTITFLGPGYFIILSFF